MTSSMLSGERRRASARRGGMTVLGKVAVPKPINLPSQRLENHGLDPSVEIVPKGSLSWGSRPSSSPSNPWGSTVPSSVGDYSSGSPSHVGGRPSSGGSGTRPSTAGSDKMHEVSSAWNSNSRPSSASGALTSNQTSLTTLRPQSAETRPGSSQLSRFAEHLPDNSAAWGPAGNADKLVIASTKNDKFSLSSGDFPTLGSERDNSGKNSDSQEYGSRDRPRSSSDEAAANDKIVTSESDVKGRTINTWRRDDTQHAEDGVEPNSNYWQGGYPQQFMNGNVPQHFDAWRGPPVNSPAGVWYRGPPGGPPYGPPVAAGGYPLEPFPYYRPQMPPPTLGNSQPVPQQVPVTGPRGHHPKNGDIYMPQIPDGYMHPGMPMRPGFYPRPVPYDNYHGAPVGYNPNERDMPYVGMSAGPPVFNRYPAHGPDHSSPHARAGGHGSTAVTSNSEQMESVNSDNSRGSYKVLGKQHNGLDTKGEEGSWENNVPGNFFPKKGGHPRSAFRKNEWGADSRREDIHTRKTGYGEYSSSGKFDRRESHSLTYARVNSLDINDRVDQNGGQKPDTASVPASPPKVPHVLTAALKDSTLLQKIDGLNAKVRASDGRREAASASSREVQKNEGEYDAISNMSKNNVGAGGVCAERPNFQNNIHSSSQSDVGTTNLRRANNGVEGRFEHHGKGRVNSSDGWRKKPLATECLTAMSTTNVEPVSFAHNQDQHIHAEVSGMINTSLSGKTEAESLTQTLDSGDTQEQRAKMREIAKQRAIQLQKEEEERIKEQKAKALAKLEELNRRSQTGDVSTEKLEKDPPISGFILDQEESEILAEPLKIACKNGAPNLVLAPSFDIAPTSGSGTSRVQESNALSKNVNIDTSDVTEQVSNAPQSLPVKVDTADVKAVLQDNDSSSSMHKLMQNVRVESLSSESLISFGTIGFSVAVEGTAFSKTAPEVIIPSRQSTSSHNSNTVHDFPAAQRKKSMKSGKNKNKLENPLPVSELNLQVSKQPNSESILESVKMKASESVVDAGSDQVVKEDVERPSQQQSLISDESHVKVNNNWKSQSRKMSKNGLVNKVVDKSQGNDAIMWAPVRSYHRVEAVNDGGKTVPDSVLVTPKNDNLGQNSVKSKRAEMERYVPKQVAKELAQLGTSQQSVSSSVAQTTLNENAGRKESSFQESSHSARSVVDNVVCAVDSNTGDSKQSKQAKAAGGWKTRGSADSSRRHMDLSLNSSKNNPKHVDQQEALTPDVNQVLVEPYVSIDWDPSDGWNMPEEPTPAVDVTFGIKDQVVVKGKGKRQPYKGHKNMVNKHDIDQNGIGGVMYKKQIYSTAPEISLPERNFTAEESRGSGERTSSLWQPKSQAYSTNTQTGSRSSVGQHVSEEAVSGTRKSSALIGDASMALDKGHSEFIPQLHLDQSSPKNRSIKESRNAVHHDGRREKKPATSKERPQPYHKYGLGSLGELHPPESGNTRFEQHSSSGFRKHGNQSNRSGRVQESREEWSSVGQESRHPNVPGNRERQPRNSHFEYQPVGLHNQSKSNNFEGLTDGSHNMGSRHRERGQGQPKRGGVNSYGQKSGATVQVDAGYD